MALWLVSSGEETLALRNARRSLDELGYAVGTAYIPAQLSPSDHRPFRRRGFRDALTLSIVPSVGEDDLRCFIVEGPWSALKVALSWFGG